MSGGDFYAAPKLVTVRKAHMYKAKKAAEKEQDDD